MTKEEYINYVMENELGSRDPDIYDIEDAYVEGYAQGYIDSYDAAIAKAVKWLSARKSDEHNSCVCIDIADFQKAMKL